MTMRLLGILLLVLPLGGCLASNLKQVVEALGKDHNQNCVIVTTIYGTVTMMRVSPNSGFKASTGQCAIDEQAGRVTVPVQMPPMQLTPAPPKRDGQLERERLGRLIIGHADEGDTGAFMKVAGW
jgi:hypothetical protein